MRSLLILLMLIMSFGQAIAQPLPPNPVPLDSGLSILAISGIVYAWKKRKSKN